MTRGEAGGRGPSNEERREGVADQARHQLAQRLLQNVGFRFYGLVEGFETRFRVEGFETWFRRSIPESKYSSVPAPIAAHY